MVHDLCLRLTFRQDSVGLAASRSALLDICALHSVS